MRGVMFGVSVVYFLLIANFYNESHGFVKYYNEYYPLWKATPLVFLAIFAALHGGGMGTNIRLRAAAGLLCGAMGDYLIGLSENGIVHGAIAFGMGHILYMSLFVDKKVSPDVPSLLAVLGIGALAGHLCLSPLLATQPVAVAIMSIYSLLLSAAFIVAISQHINRSDKTNSEHLLYRMIGFGLFFCSDNMLIYHHTGYPVPTAELLILTTYFSAQLLILFSFVSQYNSHNIQKKVK